MTTPTTSIAAERRHTESPFFSICIPQYNRTGLLIEALRCLEGQTFKSFEVCISEDNSPDGRQEEIVKYLRGSSLAFIYQPTGESLRYDANTRKAMGYAKGRYCILMGNDDCLTSPDTLKMLADMIELSGFPGVVIGNFQDWKTGHVTRRIRETRILSGTSRVAVLNYRNMAFVSGLVVDRVAAQKFATDKWDGSEMYQMYVLSRVIASGRPLLTTELSLVRKDIRAKGEHVDNYTLCDILNPCKITVRTSTYCVYGRLIADAVSPYQSPVAGAKEKEMIFRQLYLFTYPFWIFEYRRIQSWKYSLGVCLGMNPQIVVGSVDVGRWRLARLYLIWLSVCFAGLFTPVWIFDLFRTRLYSISRSFGN